MCIDIGTTPLHYWRCQKFEYATAKLFHFFSPKKANKITKSRKREKITGKVDDETTLTRENVARKIYNSKAKVFAALLVARLSASCRMGK